LRDTCHSFQQIHGDSSFAPLHKLASLGYVQWYALRFTKKFQKASLYHSVIMPAHNDVMPKSELSANRHDLTITTKDKSF